MNSRRTELDPHATSFGSRKASLLSSRLLLALDELHGRLAVDDVNATGLVGVADSVALLRDHNHLRPERSANELTTALCVVGQSLEHLRHSRAVLRVEVGVNLIEEVERRRVALLDGKDQGERAQA